MNTGELRITTPVVTRTADHTRWETPVVVDGRSTSLWFEARGEGRDMVSDRADAAVVGLLLVAMRSGLDVVVDGPVSAELLISLRRGVQDVLVEVRPNLTTVTVTANDTLPSGNSAAGVMTGFSAGVDSFATVADYHLASDLPESMRLTHLLLTNIWTSSERNPLDHHLARVAPIAQRLGLPLVVVDSNLSSFFDGTEFGESHTLRNAATAFLLQEGIGRFYYSSGYPYGLVRVAPASDIAVVDLIVLSLLSTPTVMLESVGSEHTRVEKTRLVAQVPEAHDSLFVCTADWQGGQRNCSRCGKCLRTQTTLEIGGVLPLFDAAFDRRVYRVKRRNYLTRVLAETDDHLKSEIRHFADAEGFEFPRSARLGKWPWRAARRVQSLLRRE